MKLLQIYGAILFVMLATSCSMFGKDSSTMDSQPKDSLPKQDERLGVEGTYCNGKLIVLKGDITLLDADAIVNAANVNLSGASANGGNVDGAIHAAAGPELSKACKALGGCNVGEAKITSGYNLKSRYIIHTVGPQWPQNFDPESSDANKQTAKNYDDALKNCYRNSLMLAKVNECKIIGFPSISTGAYHFPLKRAVSIVTDAVIEYLNKDDSITCVYFVCYDDTTLNAYTTALNGK